MNVMPISTLSLLLVSALVWSRPPNTLTPAETAAGWQLLFDGRTLEGWRSNEQPGTFSVKNGAIVAHGPRSHLYYVGSVQNHDFRNFELELEVMTFPQSNSGVYFHTQWQDSGWPATGHEVQINNSHTDPSRTGSLYGVRDRRESPVKDLEWFTLSFKVIGNQITTTVNGRAILMAEIPPRLVHPEKERTNRGGTFALQGHDPDSEVHFRNIVVRPLP